MPDSSETFGVFRCDRQQGELPFGDRIVMVSGRSSYTRQGQELHFFTKKKVCDCHCEAAILASTSKRKSVKSALGEAFGEG